MSLRWISVLLVLVLSTTFAGNEVARIDLRRVEEQIMLARQEQQTLTTTVERWINRQGYIEALEWVKRNVDTVRTK